MAILSLDALKKLGGNPSDNFFSNYTKICKLLQELDDACDFQSNYRSKQYQDKCTALNSLVERFHPNEIAGIAGVLTKKEAEIVAVRKLKTSMKDELEYAKICQLVDKMANSGKPLISNTGRGVREKLKNQQLGISFTTDASLNAQYSGRSLVINVANLWKTEKLAMGVIAHEFHHILSGRPADLYADEYVAHWKQYTVMELPKAKFENLNHWLLDQAGGYQLRDVLNRKGRSEFTGPQDAGDIWSKYIDNKG